MCIPIIDRYLCNGCGSCAELYPEVFEMRDEKAWVKNLDMLPRLNADEVMSCCPKMAISFDK